MTTSSEPIKAAARDLGFLACGVASLEPSRRAAALEDWLARGYGGTMRYLHRQAKKRMTPAEVVPAARVAVVVLENYLPLDAAPERRDTGPDATPDRPEVHIAKYARGADYHRSMMGRLERLAATILAQGGTVARPYVDAGPVPERELAERAGLGWIAKNTMLIRPGVGSFFFIGSVFTDLDLAPDPWVETDHCGSCTACLDACPTEAFVAPRTLDATRCTSYLTIEHRGEIPDELGQRLEGWAFGCDICQDVCPWNQKFALPSAIQDYAPRPEPDVHDREYFERLTPEDFERLFGDTPLERPGLEGMRRNWKAAFGPLVGPDSR